MVFKGQNYVHVVIEWSLRERSHLGGMRWLMIMVHSAVGQWIEKNILKYLKKYLKKNLHN